MDMLKIIVCLVCLSACTKYNEISVNIEVDKASGILLYEESLKKKLNNYLGILDFPLVELLEYSDKKIVVKIPQDSAHVTDDKYINAIKSFLFVKEETGKIKIQFTGNLSLASKSLQNRLNESGELGREITGEAFAELVSHSFTGRVMCSVKAKLAMPVPPFNIAEKSELYLKKMDSAAMLGVYLKPETLPYQVNYGNGDNFPFTAETYEITRDTFKGGNNKRKRAVSYFKVNLGHLDKVETTVEYALGNHREQSTVTSEINFTRCLNKISTLSPEQQGILLNRKLGFIAKGEPQFIKAE